MKQDRITPPKSLYKFRSLDSGSIKYTQDIFDSNNLWYSRPSDFNDPFDCAPYASMEATDDQFRSYLTDLYKRRMPELSRHQRRESVKAVMADKSRNHRSDKAINELKKALHDGVNLAGVLSLSARRDHVLMWSHYSSSHTGICLRFDTTKDKRLSDAQEVVYSIDRPALNLILDTPQKQQTSALLTKADFWSYEEEWRVIDPGPGSGARSFAEDALDGVFLGSKISDTNKDKVLSWAAKRSNPMEVYEARMHPSLYRLEFHQLI